MMKRYWLFATTAYYPWGGMEDFYGDYDTETGAKTAYAGWLADEQPAYPGGQIFDTETRKVIWVFAYDCGWSVPDYGNAPKQFPGAGL